LTLLIARKDPGRHHPRGGAMVAALPRGMRRRNDRRGRMVASCLSALAGDRRRDAAMAIRAVAEMGA
jgi:hypothetical protein